jgi:biotin synthase
METCTTLGMLTEDQARRLQEAGLDFYNHNVDTSPEFYGQIITTRTLQDRIETVSHARKAGLKVCCGGIVGLGENRRRSPRHADAARQSGGPSRKRSHQHVE